MLKAHPPQQANGVLISDFVWGILTLDDTAQQSNHSDGAAQPLVTRNPGFVRLHRRIRSHIDDRRAFRVVQRLQGGM